MNSLLSSHICEMNHTTEVFPLVPVTATEFKGCLGNNLQSTCFLFLLIFLIKVIIFQKNDLKHIFLQLLSDFLELDLPTKCNTILLGEAFHMWSVEIWILNFWG